MPVTGQRELRQLAAQLRLEANRGMQAQLLAEQRKAFAGLEPAIRANAAAMLPSGYAPTMASSVRVGIIIGTRGTLSIKAVVYALGGARGRDVRSINAGRLKHPLFGKRLYRNRQGVEKSGWFTTAVRPGFVDRAVDELPDEVFEQSKDAVDKVIARLTRG